MKVSAVIIPKRDKKHHVAFVSPSLVLSVFAVLTGFVSGALVYCFLKASVFQGVFELFLTFFTDFSNKNSPEILSGLILTELPYMIFMAILGFSVVGYPLVMILTAVKSIAPTLLFSHLYCEYGLKGAEYVFLVFALAELISIFGVLLMTQCCYTMSLCLNRSLKAEKGERREEFKNFFFKFTVSSGILIFSRFVIFITVTSFSKLFSF